MIRLVSRARAIRCLAFAAVLSLGLFPSAPTAAQTPQIGPILFLVQANSTQLGRLPATGLTVHTALLTASNKYIASGTQAAGAAATALGATVRVLDADTAGKAYFLAEADEADSVAVVTAFAPILYQDATEILVGVPVANEAAFVEQVPAEGVEIYALPLTPYVPPEEVVSAEALPTQADPLVLNLVNAVSSDALYNRMLDLSGARPVTIDGTTVTLTTSYTYSPVIRYTEQYIFNAFKQLGYNPIYIPWSKSGASGKNIVADLPGLVHPERIWIVDGHFDTTSENPYVSASGADDNASGVASVLMIAGLLRNQRFSDTIRFVGFSGEEQGMLGSQVYAAQLKQAGVQLQGVIDMDQLGYDGDNDHVFEIHSGTRSNSIELAKMFIAANNLYQQGLVIELKDTTAARWSDHSSFWDQGFAAILAEENWFTDARPRDGTPCYHRVCDKMVTVNMDYIMRAARTTLATISHLAGIITGPTPTPTNTATVTQTFTPSFTPTPSATSTPTFTPGPIACTERVTNGGFEANTNWSFGTTSRPPVYVVSPNHAGAQALQTGIPAGRANAIAHSSARQLVSLPASAATVTLTYWERTGGGDGADYREVLLLNSAGVYFRTLERNFGTGTGQWQQRTFDLTPYRGQSVYVYFNTYNNGAGGTTWNYIDDVSVLACSASTPPAITPTPSATPTVAASSTPTVTASPSATFTTTASPTETTPATATFTITASPTATATASVTPTSTETATPTETTTFTPTLVPTFTVTPSPSPTATATLTVTPTPTLGACTELVANGGFESDSGWSFGYTSRPAGYVTTPTHNGARAMRLGILAATPNANSYSSVRQVVVLPTNVSSLTLRYWERPGSGDASDYRETLILIAGTPPRTLARSFGSGNNQWQQQTFDLLAYRGRTVTLYFNVYNSGTGSLAFNYIDDVSVLACAQ